MSVEEGSKIFCKITSTRAAKHTNLKNPIIFPNLYALTVPLILAQEKIHEAINHIHHHHNCIFTISSYTRQKYTASMTFSPST
jgi:hypothetical protein